MPMEPWMTYRPEINAAAILGPGPASWFAASAVWAGQAVQVAEAQAIYYSQATIAGGSLWGLANAAMAKNVPPFAAWLAYMEGEAIKTSAANAVVGMAHTTAMATMVPLPAVLANRAAAAAATAAGPLTAAAAPMVIQLEQQYAAMGLNNGRAMQTYDIAVTTATAPRTYPTPPTLATGAMTPPMETPTQALIDQVANRGQQALNQARGQVPQVAQQAQQFATQAMAPGQQAMSMAGAAARPTTGMAQQLASRGASGVTGSGLGSGSRAMAPSPSLGRAGGGGLPAMASLGGGRGFSSPSLSSVGAGQSLGAMQRGGAVAGRMPFSGVPLTERTAGTSGMRGPLGGMPMGAMGAGNNRRRTESGENSQVEEVTVVNPVAEARKARVAEARFR